MASIDGLEIGVNAELLRRIQILERALEIAVDRGLKTVTEAMHEVELEQIRDRRLVESAPTHRFGC